MDINRLSDGITPSMLYMSNTKVSNEKAENGNVKEAKNIAQYFQDVCKKYPGAAFVAISDAEGTISDFFTSHGACDTSQFGYPGKVSFMIPQKAIEKMMNDPDYEKRMYSHIDTLIYNYASITGDIGDDMNYVAIQIKDLDDTDRYHLGFTTLASEGTMDYYINAGKQNFAFHQEMLKKFNYYNEIKYNEMLDQLFQTGK